MRGSRAGATSAAFSLLGLLPLLVLACGSGANPPPDAVQALGRVTTYTQGQPALVFVYADG